MFSIVKFEVTFFKIANLLKKEMDKDKGIKLQIEDSAEEKILLSGYLRKQVRKMPFKKKAKHRNLSFSNCRIFG